MMDMTTRPTLQHFLCDTKHGPYVSLYMSWPENTSVEALRLRFKNMVKHTKSVMTETFRHTRLNLSHMNKTQHSGKPAKQMGLAC